MASEYGEPVGQDEAAYRTEWMMLRSIDRQLREFNTIFRGDGSELNPGLVVKVDRLAQESERRQKKAERHEVWLWTLSSGMILAAVSWVIQWIGQAPVDIVIRPPLR